MTTDEPSEETLEERARLGRRARVGAVVLLIRTVLLQVTVLGGNVFLQRLLEPRDFGVFGVAQTAVAFFAIFGDAGLGAALIAQKGTPPQRELSSVFWLQLALASTVVGLIELLAPLSVTIWPGMAEHVPVVRALAASLVLTVVKVPPLILMERELDFPRIAAVEYFGRTTYFVVANLLAWKGFGVRALVAAILAEGLVSTILAFALRPWRPSFVFDRESVRPVVRFGVTYQTRNLVSFINSAITPLFAGSRLGLDALGLLTWAWGFAIFPLEVVSIVGRVAFPLYSRLQADRVGLARAIGRSIQVCALATVFFAALVLGIGDRITEIVYTAKWLPALGALRVYVAAMTLGFLAPVVAAALDASGRPGIITRLSFFWVALNWVVVPLVLWQWKGLVPYAAAYCVHMVVGNLLVVWVLRKQYPDVRFLRAILPAFAGGAVVALAWQVIPKSIVAGPVSLVLAILTSAAAFALVALLADSGLLAEIQKLLDERRRKTEA